MEYKILVSESSLYQTEKQPKTWNIQGRIKVWLFLKVVVEQIYKAANIYSKALNPKYT